MKNILSNVVIGLFALFTIGTAHAATTATIVIVSPSGGESFIVDQKQFIRLAEKTKFKVVTIELSRDAGVTFEALGTINNTVKDKTKWNLLPFTVSGAASNHCVIRATGAASNGTMAVGTSGEFTISAGGGGGAGGTISASNISSDTTPNGYVLVANGSGGVTWAAPSTGGGGGNAILNQTTPQTADFNITGNGTIGGNLNVNGSVTIPTATRYYSINYSEFVLDLTSGGGNWVDYINGYADIVMQTPATRNKIGRASCRERV